MTTEYFDDLKKKSTGQLKAIIATQKHPYILSNKSTTNDQDIFADVENILQNRRPWHEKPLWKIIIVVIGGLILSAITYCVFTYILPSNTQPMKHPPQKPIRTHIKT